MKVEENCGAKLTKTKEIEIILILQITVSLFYNNISMIVFIFSKQAWWWSKFYWLIHRGSIQVMRDPTVQFLRILLKLVIIQKSNKTLFLPS